MATIAAIAVQRSLATTRLASAAQGIAKELGVEALSLPLYNRDPDKLHAEQLTAIANYLEQILKAITPEKVEVSNESPSENKKSNSKAANRSK